MFCATLPYLRNGVKVFDIIRPKKLLFWKWWRIADTQVWNNNAETQIIVNSFNNQLKVKQKL